VANSSVVNWVAARRIGATVTVVLNDPTGEQRPGGTDDVGMTDKRSCTDRLDRVR
jgi:hypothetical protein